MKKSFQLWATVNRVHDGDTIYADLDLSTGIWSRGINDGGWGLRLVGCNARELRDEGGVAARTYLASIIPEGSVMQVESVDWDKFAGRLDVKINHPLYGDLATHLIAEQWAAPWNGKGIAPVPPWPRTV